MDRTAPAPDELEVSVFGRGYGEAICVHLGDGDWAVIDSCIEPETKRPAALAYLESLNISPRANVRLAIVTHWDDDHIQGMGDVVEACEEAIVVCSAALCRREIVAYVIEQEDSAGALGSGLDELRTILRTTGRRGGRMVWAKANLPLYPVPPGAAPLVVALSPSEDAVQRSVESLIEAAMSAKLAIARRYKAPEDANGASVVTVVQTGGISVLLGADLEVSRNKESGWDAVLAYARPSTKSSLFKVPHHGSAGAHHHEVWMDLLDDGVIAILSPWARGGGYLPTNNDLSRLRSLTEDVFLSATPSSSRARNDPELAKLLRRLHSGPLEQLRGWGHVRARRRMDSPNWQVDLDGDAVAVPA